VSDADSIIAKACSIKKAEEIVEKAQPGNEDPVEFSDEFLLVDCRVVMKGKSEEF
jgi:predicted house-cleaning NTP pyrophosphatase (Maf/HAM1 superfamily)